MELQLKNIGMIKEANVKIDGLTVIAGENDTGKSTVGKALVLYLKYFIQLKKISLLDKESEVFNGLKKNFISSNLLVDILFSKQLSKKGYIELILDKKSLKLDIIDNKIIYDNFLENGLESVDIYFPIMIESPLVWNFNKFLNQISLIQSRLSSFGDNIEMETPFLIGDIHFKLLTKNQNKSNNYYIEKNIIDIINGSFTQDDLGNFFFMRGKDRIELINTATGIKAFGILQVLSQNNYLNKETVLILDEPEVHLHPKWQLEMAKVIVELVKNGVQIVVNSHSPYMIEALKRYSEVENIESKTNFYLAEDGYIKQIENSNPLTLEKTFEKLSEPFDIFDEMDSKRLQNG